MDTLELLIIYTASLLVLLAILQGSQYLLNSQNDFYNNSWNNVLVNFWMNSHNDFAIDILYYILPRMVLKNGRGDRNMYFYH